LRPAGGWSLIWIVLSEIAVAVGMRRPAQKMGSAPWASLADKQRDYRREPISATVDALCVTAKVALPLGTRPTIAAG
jgi:hypothetical protein